MSLIFNNNNMFYYSIYHPPSSFLWTIINIQFKKQNHSNLFFLLNENIFFIVESCKLFILCYCKEYSYNINPRSNIILYFIYTDLKKKNNGKIIYQVYLCDQMSVSECCGFYMCRLLWLCKENTLPSFINPLPSSHHQCICVRFMPGYT